MPQGTAPLWTGEPLNGKKILIHAEQGLGDTIQFARFIPLVKNLGGVVIVLAERRLMRLVARTWGVDFVFDGSSYVPDFHLHAPLMSLPHILKNNLSNLPATVPYMGAEPAALDHWKGEVERAVAADQSRLREGDCPDGRRPFLIGVSWQGNPLHSTDRWR